MNALNIKELDKFRDEMKKRFLEKISDDRFFRLAVTPVSFRDIVLLDMNKVKDILLSPSYKRESGWTTETIGNFVTTLEGIENDNFSWRHLNFLKNGFLEFWVKVDESFCWQQNAEEMKNHPRLYPYVVCEYPVSFFYLLKDLISSLSISSEYIFEGGFYNCKGAYMRPGHTKSVMYQAGFYKPVYWIHDYPLELRERRIAKDFTPEPEAYNTVVEIYNAFSISDEKAIPFFDEKGNFFLKGKNR